jgi:hypothetical protein
MCVGGGMPNRPEFPNLKDLSIAELWSLSVSLLEPLAQLEGMTAALSEENTHLKEMNRRLNLKPSEMENGTAPSLPPSGRASRRQRGQEPRPLKSVRLIIDEDRVVPLPPQAGWRFNGFKLYTVQDLVVSTGLGTGASRKGIRSAVVDYAPFKTIKVDAFPWVVDRERSTGRWGIRHGIATR